ncbi:MAG: copper amine oxidase N-terminal domain-containing protein [Defluviitaleaceae bacterium]|nr:copper amine oxidase N-terminal domain-containing protein [Defluviitaleaceae bacterium]MCL2837128.1 copper amine oxidase N-terminal domain-containing protein [Defluviitaleaceae bacterium]
MSVVNKARISACVLLAALMLTGRGNAVFGGGIDVFGPIFDRVPMDLSEGSFAGLSTEFYFTLPPEWYDESGSLLVEVDRVTYAQGEDIFDAFDIYFLGERQYWLLMRLYVFDKAKWHEEDSDFTVVMKTQSYVFAVSIGDTARFTGYWELLLFDALMEPVSAPSKIFNLITLGRGHMVENQLAIFVNGILLPSPVEVVDEIFYIPLREACDVFGYQIFWDDELRRVSIAGNDGVLDSFVMAREGEAELEFLPRFDVRMINDRIYVVTAYFAGVLRKNVQIDGTNNVIITSRNGV